VSLVILDLRTILHGTLVQQLYCCYAIEGDMKSVCIDRCQTRPASDKVMMIDDVCHIKAEGYFMRVWLPDSVYKAFPAVVGVAGLLGCAAGNPASLSLGGLLLLYSGGVYCMRR
jgi:hypothetical protein